LFPKWEIKFDLFLNTEILSEKNLKNIINVAGFESGIGDLRPEKATGQYGRFTLEGFKEI
jgi:hypothetical protein